jgi:hypothetical protein
MLSNNVRRFYQRVLILTSLLVLVASGYAQNSKKENAAGPPVLWENVSIRQQDLYFGPGGKDGLPDVSRVTFIKEDKGGYSKKYRIKDASGRTWVAKIGPEAQSETAAVRLLSALGYKTEINYLIPRLTIPGKGSFTNVRLEARPEGVDRTGEWRWDKNPFRGTNQLQGLKIMMAFLNNWDMKNSNNDVLKVGNERQYIISDLGVSFGKTGIHTFAFLRWIGRSRNKPADYAKSKFVTGIKDGRLKIKYNGKNHRELGDITLRDARWLADRLTQLSDSQIRDAFRAANYSTSDVNLLTQAVKSRITQLDRAAINGRVARGR